MYQNDVLEMFSSPINEDENPNLPQPLQPPDVFFLARNNFHEWLHVWKMELSDRNPQKSDLVEFARANKEKFVGLVEREIRDLNSVKVSFEVKVQFSGEKQNGEKKIHGTLFPTKRTTNFQQT